MSTNGSSGSKRRLSTMQRRLALEALLRRVREPDVLALVEPTADDEAVHRGVLLEDLRDRPHHEVLDRDRRVGVRDVELADVRVGVAHRDLLLEVDRRLVPPAHEVRHDRPSSAGGRAPGRRRGAARAWARMLHTRSLATPAPATGLPSSGGVRRPARPPRRGRGAGARPRRCGVPRPARRARARHRRDRGGGGPALGRVVVRDRAARRPQAPRAVARARSRGRAAARRVPRPRRRGGVGARLLGPRRAPRRAARRRARSRPGRRRWRARLRDALPDYQVVDDLDAHPAPVARASIPATP